ncbi:MAG: efflux RND transporter periplasmic adaptor subunit [Paramuribaculum sp.]|nr:efflux RND transporter periplasmic adaptor subunit [Paramuribaculum sp.]
MKTSYTFIFGSLLLLWSCEGHNHNHEHGHDHDHDAHEETMSEENHDHGDEIVMSPKDAAAFGVKTDTVCESQFNYVINVTGEITGATDDIAILSAPTSGMVSFNNGINVGSRANIGQIIATVKSTDVSGGNPDKAALIAMNAAKSELDRLTPLYADGLVTRNEYNSAKAEYERAKATYSPKAASGTVISPIRGIISELLVQTGAYVSLGQPIATVSKNNALILRADLPEKYRTMVSNIESANVRTVSGDKWINVKRDKSVNDVISSNIMPGYIPVYFNLSDADDFSSGSFVDVCLVGDDSASVITVKNSAISEQQGEYFVYVKIDDHGYQKRNVRLGQSDGLRTVVLSGLNPGEVVVSDGVTMIRLAETSTVVPEGHSHNH